MNTMTVRDFRTNLAANFDRVDAVERTVEDDDLTISPELQAKIDKARQEYKEGKTITCRSHEELDAFLESL